MNIIVRNLGNEYEVIRAGAQPLSSCSELVQTRDYYSARQFISHLDVSPETWRTLFMRLGVGAPPNFHDANEIIDAVARLCAHGDLRFYKLIKIEKLKAVACEHDMGIVFVKGPNPPRHFIYASLIIDNTKDATDLVKSLTAKEQDIINCLGANGLQSRFLTSQDVESFLIENLLAKNILAYKLPVYSNAPPKNQGESIPATGPGYDKVSLAPESKPAPPNAVDEKTEIKSAGPQTLGDAALLLANSRKRLTETGIYEPKYSSDQLDAMAKEGIVAKERFIVSLQKTKTTNDAVGYQRPNGPTTAWTTTLDLIENADTDPELICDLNGMHFDPAAHYEMIIIDQGKYYKQDGAENFVPTYDRLKVLGKKEFSKQFNTGQIDSVLTPQYTEEYKAAMGTYKGAGGKPWDSKEVDKFVSRYYKSDGKKQNQFYARNTFNTQVGCNEHFSGDGVTKTTGLSPYGVKEGQNGNLEMLLFEHNPETVGDLQKRGAILRITATPIKRA